MTPPRHRRAPMLIALTMSALLLLSGAERYRPWVVSLFLVVGVILVVGLWLTRRHRQS